MGRLGLATWAGFDILVGCFGFGRFWAVLVISVVVRLAAGAAGARGGGEEDRAARGDVRPSRDAGTASTSLPSAGHADDATAAAAGHRSINSCSS